MGLDMFTELSVPGFASHRGSNGSHLDPGRRVAAKGPMRGKVRRKELREKEVRKAQVHC